jgi:radical SAM protein with 4Fe4S-binding SPASM domain
MRSGSTWLQMMMGQLCDVVTDFEMKWRPSYELQKLHVAIRGPDFSFQDFFNGLGNPPVKGSKLTFDFFPPDHLEQLSECLPADISIIHLTRNYFDVLNSFYRGIFHDYEESPAILRKSPASHEALGRSNKNYEAIKGNTSASRVRKVDPAEAARYLDIFLSVDRWASGLAFQKSYMRIDYSQINDQFINLARFIGSKDSEINLKRIMKSPPTKKLRSEIVIANECEIRDMVRSYEKQKCFPGLRPSEADREHPVEYPVQNAMLQLSGVCNYRCAMCAHASQNHGRMSDEVFERTLEDCKKCGIHTLIFAGAWGEPTLHPKWKEFIKCGIEQNFRVILSTNGSRLDADAISFLSTSGLKSLQISYAGYDKKSYESTYVHGDFAGMKNVLSSVKKAFLAVPNPPEIVINGVILEPSPDRFVDETYTFLYSCGFSDLEIQMTWPNNYAGKRNDLRCASRRFEKESGKSSLALCPILRDVIGVYWDGEITACACLDNERKMLIGNIVKESVADMRRTNIFQNMLAAFSKNDLSAMEMCAQCEVPYRCDQNVRILPTWQRSIAGIRILEATYGWNCRDDKGVRISPGNVTAVLRKKCDGREGIVFQVDVTELGDPAPGRAKDLSISWRYAEDPKMISHSFYVPAEAHGQKVTLPCASEKNTKGKARA